MRNQFLKVFDSLNFIKNTLELENACMYPLVGVWVIKLVYELINFLGN